MHGDPCHPGLGIDRADPLPQAAAQAGKHQHALSRGSGTRELRRINTCIPILLKEEVVQGCLPKPDDPCQLLQTARSLLDSRSRVMPG